MIVSSTAFECEEVKGEGGVPAISLCPPLYPSTPSTPSTISQQVSLGSSVHTFYFHNGTHNKVPLFILVRHPCVLHMSNLEAVIDQFGQNECLSKCPWQRSMGYCGRYE